jgi:hypothetical protein
MRDRQVDEFGDMTLAPTTPNLPNISNMLRFVWNISRVPMCVVVTVPNMVYL